MGVLNLTPDSFSDGGLFNKPAAAKKQLHQLIKDGAAIIDIGAESTRPGSSKIYLKEELRRLKPIINYIYKNKLFHKARFSIDTYKAGAAEYALKHGFSIVNDVTALRGDKNMIKILLRHKPYIILMHSKDTGGTTIKNKNYSDVINSIIKFLNKRIKLLLAAGFPKEKIIIDLGMGAFVSANKRYSFEIIGRLRELKILYQPILVGISRKLFPGASLEEKDRRSVKWSLKAIKNGADIIRLHNPKLIYEKLKK